MSSAKPSSRTAQQASPSDGPGAPSPTSSATSSSGISSASSSASSARWQSRAERYFRSPVITSVDELVALRELSSALLRGSKRKVRSQQSGGAVSKILGRGLDFAEVRSYQAGDDVRMIDWNVTARTGNAHTKLFVEERERPFFLVIDYRSGMRFATQRMFKSVMAARLASILGWGAVSHNDCVGGMVFADARHLEIKPQPGRRGLMMLFRAIETAQAQQADNGQSLDLAQQLSRLRHIAPTGCSICILSDFNGFGDAAESAMGPLLQRCDVLAVTINDPLDLALPQAGNYALADANGRVGITTHQGSTHADYARKQQHHNDRLRQFFSRRRGRFLNVATNDDVGDVATLLLRQASLVSR